MVQYNTDTVILNAMGGQWDQQRILYEIDKIGIKPVEPTYVAPQSDFSKYGRKELDKTEEMALKQQKTAAQVLVAIKKRCEPGVLDHTSLILNAPGASARTKLISFVQFIEGRRLCDLSVVTVVQDDIRSLDPIITFADAMDNMIAINLLQEELLMMGQPYSDADLIIQHSNKMPNSENFRALKMEFIDCDVSQFSTSRPSLIHNQPNPQHLRIRKTWDEYCHRIQRFNASDPTNQPKSALSAKMHTDGPTPEVKALAAAEEPLEVMMKRIISEFKSNELKQTYSQLEREAYKRGRQDLQEDRRQYQERSRFPPSTSSKNVNPRYTRPNQAVKQPATQGNSGTRGQIATKEQAFTQGDRFRKYGKETDSKRRRPEDKRAYGAYEQEDNEYGEPQDRYNRYGHQEDRDEDEDGDDRHAMMGKRDYDFNGLDEDEVDNA